MLGTFKKLAAEETTSTIGKNSEKKKSNKSYFKSIMSALKFSKKKSTEEKKEEDKNDFNKDLKNICNVIKLKEYISIVQQGNETQPKIITEAYYCVGHLE
jgi:hypothetical protein